MSILMPQTGLLFWMLVSFAVVAFALIRYGFPMILSAVDKRKAYIEQGVEASRQAQERLNGVKAEAETLLSDAHTRAAGIVDQARKDATQVAEGLRQQAQSQASDYIRQAEQSAAELKAKALEQALDKIAALSVSIASKVVDQEIKTTESQRHLIERLLAEQVTEDKTAN